MNYKTQLYIQQLDNQYEKVKLVEDDEIKSMLTKFLCVRTSGLLENYIKARIGDYTQSRVPKEVNRYISQKFKDITNLKCNRLKDVLDSFSNKWSEEFHTYLEEHEQQKNSIESLITNRHNIAHGQNAGMSFSNLEQYYADVKAVITKLETIIR